MVSVLAGFQRIAGSNRKNSLSVGVFSHPGHHLKRLQTTIYIKEIGGGPLMNT